LRLSQPCLAVRRWLMATPYLRLGNSRSLAAQRHAVSCGPMASRALGCRLAFPSIRACLLAGAECAVPSRLRSGMQSSGAANSSSPSRMKRHRGRCSRLLSAIALQQAINRATFALWRSRISSCSAAGSARVPIPCARHPKRAKSGSFNSHKIHLDRDYAETVEGYPDLVVNGGLTTLLLCEAVRRECGFDPHAYTVRNRSPLFCGSPITIFVAEEGNEVRAAACDPDGAVAAEMEISRDGV
jgi:hypothetical protein